MQSSFVVASQYLQTWQLGYHIAGQNSMGYSWSGSDMVYYQLLECSKGNFGVQLKALVAHIAEFYVVSLWCVRSSLAGAPYELEHSTTTAE